MDTLETLIPSYIEFCKCQKMLDEKTLKAYSIDLKQFQKSIPASSVLQITPCTIESFIFEWILSSHAQKIITAFI